MSRLSAVYRSTRRHARCDELAADALILMQLLSALGGRVWHHCLLRVLVVSFERCCDLNLKKNRLSNPSEEPFILTNTGIPIRCVHAFYATLELPTTVTHLPRLSRAHSMRAACVDQSRAPCAPALAAAHAPRWERSRSLRAREMPSRMPCAPFITIALEMRCA